MTFLNWWWWWWWTKLTFHYYNFRNVPVGGQPMKRMMMMMMLVMMALVRLLQVHQTLSIDLDQIIWRLSRQCRMRLSIKVMNLPIYCHNFIVHQPYETPIVKPINCDSMDIEVRRIVCERTPIYNVIHERNQC